MTRRPTIVDDDAWKRRTPTARKRLALADDDPKILETVALLLADSYEIVVRASDGQALVDAVGVCVRTWPSRTFPCPA